MTQIEPAPQAGVALARDCAPRRERGCSGRYRAAGAAAPARPLRARGTDIHDLHHPGRSSRIGDRRSRDRWRRLRLARLAHGARTLRRPSLGVFSRPPGRGSCRGPFFRSRAHPVGRSLRQRARALRRLSVASGKPQDRTAERFLPPHRRDGRFRRPRRDLGALLGRRPAPSRRRPLAAGLGKRAAPQGLVPSVSPGPTRSADTNGYGSPRATQACGTARTAAPGSASGRRGSTSPRSRTFWSRVTAGTKSSGSPRLASGSGA